MNSLSEEYEPHPVRVARGKWNWSQRRLADAAHLGSGQSAVSMIEAQNWRPGPSIRARIAEAVEEPESKLFPPEGSP